MSVQQDKFDRPLGILGINETEERVYRWLLANPRASVAEAARNLALSPSRAQRLLDAIDAKGLSTHTPERPRRYIPVAPDIAVEALALQTNQAVRRAQKTIPDLQEEAAAARPLSERELMVEWISSRDALGRVFDEIQESAQREILSMVRAPILVSELDNPHSQDTERRAQARGVLCRSLVASDFLATPKFLPKLKEDARAGEVVRVARELPFKMFLIDRRVALIPLDPGDQHGSSLIVRSSTLLDALYTLFEMLWDRASPISFSGSNEYELEQIDTLTSAEVEDLMALLAAGLNDKSIVEELDMSHRTLHRRIAALMQELGARTRYQAGWLAALRLFDDTNQTRGGSRDS